MNKDVLQVYTQQFSTIGDYDVKIRAGLDLDGDGTWEHTSNDANFILQIRACQLERVNITPINPRKYMVSKPELEI